MIIMLSIVSIIFVGWMGYLSYSFSKGKSIKVLGIKIQEDKMKPKCKLVGLDSNTFVLIGAAQRALKDAGMKAEAKEMVARVFKAHGHDEALAVILAYVECIVDEDDNDGWNEHNEDDEDTY